ncbi:hypothetical protein LJC04_03560 [Ruminococcaceae bacterium OttesenSCG-928-O06]|nr:hypothetical protein [Ruminococcaceae bacterium OttesenSCG-928-O06]
MSRPGAAQETSPKKWTAQKSTYALMVLFSVVNLALTIYQFVQGNNDLALRGVLFPLFLLIPWVFRRVGLQHCWRLYTAVYLFSLFAYSYGCVYGGFKDSQVMDKVSHFFSGFLFAIVGFCLFYWQAGPQRALRAPTALAAGYGLFFSAFVAVAWEIVEYFDFMFTGNDSQNHLTTGVFDTMHDIMACMAASVLSAAAFVLWRKKGVKLLSGWVVEEFVEKNLPAPGSAPQEKPS